MNIETSAADDLMNQIFAMGPKILELFDTPEISMELLEGPVGLAIAGGLVLLVILGKAIAKSRARKRQEEKRLEELEAALLDEDFEERALPVTESAPSESWETEEDIARIMESEPDWESQQSDWNADPDEVEQLNPQFDTEETSSDSSLWEDQDPEFSNQIRITAQSRRMSPPEDDTLPMPPPAESSSHAQEIEQEFQQLEADLRSKTLEVEKKHRLNLETQPETEPKRTREPLVLSLDDIVEDAGPDNPQFDNDDEIADLFVDDLEETKAPLSKVDEIDQEMQDSLESFSASLKELDQPVTTTGLEPETDPLADMLLPEDEDLEESPQTVNATAEEPESVAQPEEKADPFKPYIDKLEIFQKDMESRFQALALESLAEKNSQLVKSLNEPPDEEERVDALHQQKRTVDLLSSMMFVGGAKRH